MVAQDDSSRLRNAQNKRIIGLYFGLWTFMGELGDPNGLANLPILFTLKQQLGYGPQAMALLEALILLPACIGFVFGFIRDHLRLNGIGDRTYLIVAAPFAAACYLWLGVGPISFAKLLTAALAISVAFQFLDTALDSLLTAVAQKHKITGRLTALTEGIEVVPAAIAMLAGGWMFSHASAHSAFLAAALCAASLSLLAKWQPSAIFIQESPKQTKAIKGLMLVRGLLRSKSVIPAVFVLILWNFSPGFVTPLFYYMTDSLGITAMGFGAYRALNLVAVAGASLVYAILCQRLTMRRLLVLAVVSNMFPGALLLAMHSAKAAIVIAPIIGFISGFANLAVFDLMRRSCPAGMEGMGTSLGFSMFAVAGIAGDLLGAFIYERGGFLVCLLIDAAMTALILPVLKYVPQELLGSRDGGPTESAEPGNSV